MDDGGLSPAHQAESQGCLLIVAAFAEVAGALEPVATDAADRIMISPVLGDFIELRFLDIGPRPQNDAGFAAAAARIAEELTQPGHGAEQNYFALAMADNSAYLVERMLGACAADPVVAALPLRCRGLAAIDDRQPGADRRNPGPGNRQPGASEDQQEPATGTAGPATGAAVVIPESGGWVRRELINELRTYAETLLHDFATGHKRGLTLAELGSLRSRDEEILLGGPAEPAVADPNATSATASPAPPQATPSSPPPGPLPPPSPPVPPEKAPAAWAGTALYAAPAPERAGPAPSWTDAQHRGPRWRLWPRRGRGEGSVAGPSAAQPGTAQRGTAVPGTAEPASAVAPRPPVTAPVLMVLSGGGGPNDHTGWKRGRDLLSEVDRLLAATPQARFAVRALLSAENPDKSTLRPAGTLSRRDMKRPASYVDFAQLLALLRTAVKRDIDSLARSGAPVAPPGVVLYAVEPPLADAVTAEVYQELAHDASVIWVLPANSADLLSPVFTAAAWVVPDHPAAACEVTDLLRLNSEIVPAQGKHGKPTG